MNLERINELIQQDLSGLSKLDNNSELTEEELMALENWGDSDDEGNEAFHQWTESLKDETYYDDMAKYFNQ